MDPVDKEFGSAMGALFHQIITDMKVLKKSPFYFCFNTSGSSGTCLEAQLKTNNNNSSNAARINECFCCYFIFKGRCSSVGRFSIESVQTSHSAQVSCVSFLSPAVSRWGRERERDDNLFIFF